MAQARSAAIKRGRTHLREQHGAESCLERRLPGNVREYSGINERLLDKDQRKQYTEFVRATGRGGSKYRMKLRDGMKAYLWLGVWVAVLALFLLPDWRHPNLFLAFLMLAWVLVGWAPVIWITAREMESWRLRLVSTYLDSLGFEQRDPQVVGRDYDDSDDYMSKRQRDHLWYGDHSELNWRDREQAQAWGMDADTYVSNWLENDRD